MTSCAANIHHISRGWPYPLPDNAASVLVDAAAPRISIGKSLGRSAAGARVSQGDGSIDMS